MARVSTLDRLLVPLMDAPSVRLPFCAVCGRPAPLEQHHVVFRSAGRLYRNGVEVPKPTLTLCGFGNSLRDAGGRYYCHGLAHARMLHFRWVPAEGRDGLELVAPQGAGHLEYLLTGEPVKYADALGMDGWRRLRNGRFG